MIEEMMINARNVTEYKKKNGRLLAESNANLFLPTNAGQSAMNTASQEKDYQAVWRERYSEKYNKKWGRAYKEKIVKEVDTFGGKYE